MQNNISFEILDYHPSTLETNFQAFKENLENELEKYKGVTVTEDSLPVCKDIKRELSHRAKEIETFRKEVKKTLSAPIKDFDSKCKELQELILEVEAPIDEGINMYNEKFREEKLDLARKYLEELAAKMNFDGIDEVEIKSEYGNISKTQKEIKEDITAQIIALQEKRVARQKQLDVFETIINLENENLISKMSIDDFKEYIDEEYEDAFVIRKIKERSKLLFEAEKMAREETARENPENGQNKEISASESNSYLIRVFDDKKTSADVLKILKDNGYMALLEK